MRMKTSYKQAWHSISKHSALILLLCCLPSTKAWSQIKISPKYEKVANSIILDCFEDDGTIEIIPLASISDEYHIYKRINRDGKNIGTLVFAAAKGRYDYFDYVVILNAQQKIERIKILRYRSDHGYQIASVKWLEEFQGYTGQKKLVPGEDVDAVSGASISSVSICNDLFFILKKLQSSISQNKNEE